MVRFIVLMFLFASLTALGLSVIDRAHSQNEAISQLKAFHHWTVQAHWTNPVTRTITVLLDEEAVSGSDSACDAVLVMLDELTSIVPTWEVKMISPTGWVPSNYNPINRAGVDDIICNGTYKGMAADDRWAAKIKARGWPDCSDDPDDRDLGDRVQPVAYPSLFQTQGN
jgi:hypothetical protein